MTSPPQPASVPLAPRTSIAAARRWSGWPAAGALLAIHFLLATSAAWPTTVTFDEPAHLYSGLAFTTTNQYLLNAESGNLAQRWGALPLVLAGERAPALEGEAPSPTIVWGLGQDLLFGGPGRAERLLHLARPTMALLAVAAGALVYHWARRLFGPTSAMVSLALFAFCPTFLAHGPLVAADVAAALFFTAALGAGWRLLHRLSPGTVASAGLALGGLCLTKMSWPLLAPAGALCLAVRLAAGRPLILAWGSRRWIARGRARQAAWLAGGLATATLIAWGLIWAAYGGRFAAAATPRADGLAMPGWPQVLAAGGPIADGIEVARDARLLPEAFLYGLGYTLRSAETRNAYLCGEFSATGWPHFFPLAFLMKTPLASLAAILLAVAAAGVGRARRGAAADAGRPPGARARRWQRGSYRAAPLLVFLAVYWVAAITSNLNLGIRHLLPVYAATYILAGAAGRWLRDPRPAVRLGMSAVLVTLVLECTLAWPHFISYFHRAVGGPAAGYKHLVDSSLDWGQDLPYVGRWVREHGLDRPAGASGGAARDRVYLSYFGNGDPRYEGLDVTLVEGFGKAVQVPPLHLGRLEPGFYIVSATMLSGTYFPPAVGTAWLPDYERAYRELEPAAEAFLATADDPAARSALLAEGGPERWSRMIPLYRALRAARLCAYLRQREPDARVTYSYFVYALTAEDLERALEPRR